MNKKSKRITLGLVSALCLLLVVALGFGVTGAWYRARRQATGTIKLDKGINLTVENLDEYGDPENTPISSSVTGNLWVLNTAKTDVEPLITGNGSISTQPGATATKNVIVPSIGADTDSTSFYAKAKIDYEFIKFNSANDRTLDTAHPLTLADLFTGYDDTANDNAGDKVAATLANIFANQLTFTNMWESVGTHGYMMYTGTTAEDVSTITAATFNATAAIDAGETVALFTDETVANTAGEDSASLPVDVVTLVDWTVLYDTSGNVNDYVEFGGPKFYAASQFGDGENQINAEADLATIAPAIEIAQINIRITIDVIQAENLTEAAMTAWKAAA